MEPFNRSFIKYDGGLVRSANLPEHTEEQLLQKGLPFISSEDAVLGVRFQSFTNTGLIQAGDRKLLPIGYEWSPEDAILGLAAGSGHLYSFHPSSGQCGFVNSDIRHFLSFLSSIRSFTAGQSQEDTMTIMSSAEAHERLAAFRRGEIIPKQPKQQGLDRTAELSRLRALLEEKDPLSLADEDHWWSCVLEQLEDGLL